MSDETVPLTINFCTCVRTRALLEARGSGNFCPRCGNRMIPPPADEQNLTEESDLDDESDASDITNFSNSDRLEEMELERALLRLQEIPFNLTPFSGIPGEDFDAFLSKFNSFCAVNNKPLDYKVKKLPFVLSGRAYKIYDSLSPALKENFDGLCQELRLHFGHLNLPSDIAHQKLQALKMFPGSSVQDFYEKLTTYSANLDVSQGSLKALFLGGLPSSIKEYVQIRQPASLQEAVRLAIQAEAISSTEAPPPGHVALQVKDLSQKLDKLSSVVESKTAAATNLDNNVFFANLDKKMNYLSDAINTQPQPFNKSDQTCQLCSKRGHLASNCRNRFSLTEKNPQSTKQIICQICQARNHSALNCFHRFNKDNQKCQLCNSTNHLANTCQRFRQNKSNEPRTQNNYPVINNAKLICTYCNKPNHSAQDCYSLQRDKNAMANSQLNPAQSTRTDKSYKRDPRNAQYFTNQQNNNVSVTVPDRLSNRIVVDMGTFAPFHMTIPVDILHHKGDFLIDTGSGVTAINQAFLQYFAKSVFIYPPKLKSITVVDGQPTNVFGFVTLPTKISEKSYDIDYHVMNTSLYDGIFGRDFLINHHSLVDLKNNQIHLDLPINEPLIPKKTTHTQPALLKDTITIPPFSEILASVHAFDFYENEQLILDNAQLSVFKHHDVFVAASIGTVQKSLVPCRLFNTAPVPVVLQQGMQIGTLQLYEDPPISGAISSKLSHQNTPVQQNGKLEFNIEDDDLTDEQKKKLLDLLHKYAYVFSHSDTDLGCTDLVEHEIDVGNAPPIRSKPYRSDRSTREELRTHIQDMLDADVIEPSTSPWASPVLLVSKKDGGTRFVCDFRKLNAVTRKDSFPLPRVDETLESLSGSVFFSCLDLKQGFHQVPIAQKSRPLTAFISYEGLYQFKKLAFGLCNAPSTFQRLMELVLRGLNWKICLIYIDDIVTFSRTFDEHLSNLEEIFQRLTHANLKLKPSKCVFMKKEVQFLGHTISSKGISPATEKTKLIEDCQPPKTSKQVKQFLGLAGYYRRFVPNFAHISVPLTRLLRKSVAFNWTEQCQDAFLKLKTALVSPPILCFPDFTKQFHLWTDASGIAIAMILGHIVDGEEKVIAYAGRVLSKSEQNYGATALEGLAVVEGVKHFRCYLYGHKFTIHTDHSSLTWLFKTKDLTGKFARWVLYLQGFQFDIVHRAGRENQNADALSRIQEQTVCTANNNTYKPQKIGQLQRSDPELVQLIQFLESGQPYTAPVCSELSEDNSDNFFLDEDLVLFRHTNAALPYDPVAALVVPKHLRKEILYQYHDSPLAGHLGFDKTYEKIKLRYYWPKMYSQVKDWVATCEQCNKRKRNYAYKPAPLQPIPVGQPFDRVSLDLMGPFKETPRGNKHILVIVDAKTKWVESCALKATDSQQIATAFFDLIITRYGAPHTILTDRGANLISALMKDIYKIMNSYKLNTSSYHPMCNGQTEKMNGSLIQGISMYTDKHQTDWDLYLNGVLFGYRTAVSAATKCSPYLLLFGRHPRLPADVALLPPSKLSSTDTEYRSMVIKNLAIAQEIAQHEIEKNQIKAKTYYDKSAAPTNIKVGQKVLVHDPKKTKGLSKKLQPHYIGPCVVTQEISPVLFKIEGLPDKRMNNIIHVNRLKPLAQPIKNTLRETILPRMDDTNNDENVTTNPADTNRANNTNNDATIAQNVEHEDMVESNLQIINHRRRKQKVEYLCKLAEEPVSMARWLSPNEIDDMSLVNSYLQSRPERPNTRSKSTISPVIAGTAPFICAAILIASLIQQTCAGPRINALYNCDISQYEGVYALPPTLDCPSKAKNGSIHAFLATVYQYHPQQTPLNVFHCEAHKLSLTCKESFFAVKAKHSLIEPIVVSAEMCKQAILTKQTKFGKLSKVGDSFWQTNNHEHFTCKWLKQTTEVYFLFRYTKYPASLFGQDRFVHQQVTQTVCNYDDFSCKPQEDKSSILYWFPKKHRFSLYRSLGSHSVKRVHDFVLIPSIGIGGSILYSSFKTLLLDTGYKVVVPSPKNSSKNDFDTETQAYLSKAAFNVRDDLAEGKMVQELMHSTETLLHLSHHTCTLNKEIRSLQRWLLTSFPDTAAEYLFPDLGRMVEQIGEALLVHKCKVETKHTILWNQTYNGSCFHNFPVIVSGHQDLYFLDLAKRRLMSHSPRIPCPPRKKPTYVYDDDNKLWRLDPTHKFFLVKPLKNHKLNSHVLLPKLAHFSMKLLHYDKKQPSRLPLLKLLAHNKDALEEISSIKESASGDFITGVGRMLGSTLESVADGGSKIIRSLGASIHESLSGVSDLDEHLVASISNATSSVIDSSSSGLAKLIGSIGGLGNLILWILVIILYLLIGSKFALPFCRTFRVKQKRPVTLQPIITPLVKDFKPQSSSSVHNSSAPPLYADLLPENTFTPGENKVKQQARKTKRDRKDVLRKTAETQHCSNS